MKDSNLLEEEYLENKRCIESSLEDALLALSELTDTTTDYHISSKLASFFMRVEDVKGEIADYLNEVYCE